MGIGYTLYLKETYGITAQIAAGAAPEVQEIAMKALLVVAGADGLSAREREHFFDWQKMCGAPEATVEALKKFDYASVDLEKMMAEFVEASKRLVGADAAPGMWRCLIYDAIRLASADHEYSDAERTALRKVAELLGVDVRCVAALERQVELEKVVRDNRMSLIYTGA